MPDIPSCIWGGHWIERVDDATEIAALLAAAGGTAPGGETAAYTGADLDFERKNAVLRHELLAGRKMGVLREYRGIDDVWPYNGGVGPDTDNHDFEQWAYDRGCRMVISFQSRFSDGTYVPFSQVPTGVVDAELEAVADQIAAFMANYTEPMVICPTHEPDMAYADTGETVAEMRAAYQAMFVYIRDLFEAKWDADHPSFDQTKIKWATIFVGNAAFWTGADGALALYPGNDYVDYVGGDVYNGFGTATIGGQWGSLLEKIEPFLIFGRSLGKVGQYLLLGETGLIEGSPVIPDGSFGPSVGPITIDIEPAQTIIAAGYVVDFFNGITAVVAAQVNASDTTIDLESLPGTVDASTPGAANTVVQRKAAWFAEALVDIPASIPELRYFCYFTGGSERWYLEQPYQGSEPSREAWAAMGADPYFQNLADVVPETIPMLLRCVDDDQITVLLDLTELNNGASAGFGIPPDGFDLGGGDFDDEWIDDYAYDGGVQVAAHHPPTISRFPLLLFGLTADDMRDRLRLLNQLLDERHLWEYRPQGATRALIFQAERSPKVKLLKGDRNELMFVMNNLVGQPVLELHRQPLMHMTRLEGVVHQSVSNVPGDNFVLFTNDGNTRSPIRVSIQPQHSETELVGVRMAVVDYGNLTERASTFLGLFADEMDYPTGSSTTGHGTNADTDAANGFVAISTFPNVALLPRLRSPDDWRPLDPTALIGPSRVIVTGYADPGPTYRLQARAGLLTPLPDTTDITILDLTNEDLTDPVRFSIDLGLIQFDELGDALALEIHAACDEGGVGHTIAWDTVKLLPAGRAITGLYEPTYLRVIPGQTTWDPHDFIVPDHIDLPSTDAVDDGPAESVDGLGEIDISDDDRVVIGRADVVGTGDNPDRTDEAVGTAPNSGIKLQPGFYEVIATLSILNKDKEHGKHADLRVRNLTDGADVAKTTAYSEKGLVTTKGDWRARFEVDDADDEWQIQVVYVHDRDPLSGTPLRHKVYVDALSMTYVRTVSAPERVVMDSLTSPERGYASRISGKSHDLVMTNAPDVGPGTVMLAFEFLEIPVAGTDAALNAGTQPLPTWWANRRYKILVDLDRMVTSE